MADGALWDDLRRMRRDVEDIFSRAGLFRSEEVFPNIRIRDLPDELLVVAELPGVAKEDLRLNLEGDRLTLRGKRQKPEAFSGGAHSVGAEFSDFSREVLLPSRPKGDAVKAELRNGLLTVRLTKAEDTRTHDIPIT